MFYFQFIVISQFLNPFTPQNSTWKQKKKTEYKRHVARPGGHRFSIYTNPSPFTGAQQNIYVYQSI